ncbi:MAG: hypothetical protein KDC54_05195, partial [Lewinella sp.]|nr:hypothetical protein [Lewinella sp.]
AELLSCIEKLYVYTGNDIDELVGKEVKMCWTEDSLFLVEMALARRFPMSRVLAASTSIDLQKCMYEKGFIKDYALSIAYESAQAIEKEPLEELESGIKKEVVSSIAEYYAEVDESEDKRWSQGPESMRTSVLGLFRGEHGEWLISGLTLSHDPGILLDIGRNILDYVATTGYAETFDIRVITVPVSFYELH